MLAKKNETSNTSNICHLRGQDIWYELKIFFMGLLCIYYFDGQEDQIRVRSHIFPKEYPSVVYQAWDS